MAGRMYDDVSGCMLSIEQQTVVRNIIENPGKSYAVYGAAGTGKSVVLRAIAKRVPAIVLGPTGMSIAGVDGAYTISKFMGVTSQSLGSAGLIVRKFRSPITPQAMVGRTIIIDEISMVCVAEWLALNQGLQNYMGSTAPFGGIRLVLIGDPLQLRPAGTAGRFYFETAAYQELKVEHSYVLIQQERQKDSDPEAQDELRNLLHHMRRGTLKTNERASGYLLYVANVRTPLPNAVHLFPTCEGARKHNNRRVATLDGLPLVLSPGEGGDVELRDGARVTVTRNIYDEQGGMIAANGTLGTAAISISLLTLWAASAAQKHGVNIVTDGGDTIVVKPVETKVYDASRTIVVKKTYHYPILMAYALSIHRAQGQTFHNGVCVHGDKMFEAQQAYVACSRVRTLAALSCVDVLPSHFDDMKRSEALQDFVAATNCE